MDLKKMKQKKLLLLVGVPIFLALLVSLVFLGLDGFSDYVKPNQETDGLNTTLPSPNIDDKNPLDKFSIYRQAEKDSIDKAQERNRDPYFQMLRDSSYLSDNQHSNSSGLTNGSRYSGWQDQQSKNDAILQQKLKQLQDQLVDEPPTLSSKQPDLVGLNNLPTTTNFPIVRQETPARDPELMQIDSVLNKILDIQHPERLSEQFSENVIKDGVKPFQVTNRLPEHTLLWKINTVSIRSRFYELNETEFQDSTNAIMATIHGTQMVTAGMSVAIRLDQDIYLGNATIPAGSLVHGEGNLEQDRFSITVKSITYRHSLFPVSMVAYSLDGLPGVPINGAMSQQAAKQGIERGVQGVQLTTLNPSLAAQAASAGIESAKSLLTRRARLIKVTLKDGHPILLRNTLATNN